ncbi:cell wall hydrolase [Sphingomonas sp. G124]|uniref:Cell wall hydrolase n=1 Tax=Sphingomonas cremea TaxID=2904799 RepID=A0A9X1QNX5_9SPHN|nr:cell wall hydrolase [Sphingomonas cremea]MCF2515522.1 cell wall hydrolase [Sphingomonas cremea]
MKKFLGTGGASAFAAAMLLTVGGSGQAVAQQVTNLPVVQAVVRTTTTVVAPAAAAANTAPATTAPAAPMSLTDLVNVHRTGAELDEQGQCLATAVYFESMGEPLEGQLAVANVVINRAKSGRYPASWCGVVKQKAQFSFVRSGRFPRIDYGCDAWAKAQAIARIAALNLTSALPQDVLWYHADYVAPRWRNNLRRVEKIGAHIFYRG